MTRAATAGARNNSASLRRALGILLWLGQDAAADPGGATLTELAGALAMNKSTLLRLLAPLVETRLVEHDAATGRYRLGSRTAQLGQAYLERLDLRGVAHGVLSGLTAGTGETSHLVIPDLPEVVYLDKVDSPHPVRMHSRIGSRQPAYCTAMGKALLAYSGEDAFRQVVEHGMPRRTPNTLTSARALRAELVATRRRGYAIDQIENEADVRCVAAPVFDHAGAVTCAVSVSGPAGRVTGERVGELGALVIAAAAEISQRLGAR